MYRVIVSDLDGTLLLPDNTMSSLTRETLECIINHKQVNLVLATGRHHTNVKSICNTLKIKVCTITSNGARVNDANGNLILSRSLDYNVVTDLFNVVRNFPEIIANIYCDNEQFTNFYTLNSVNSFKNAISNHSMYESHLLNLKGISKIFFTCEKYETLLALEQEIITNLNNKVSVSFSTLTCLEVMASGVSKGNALKIVVKYLGYKLKDCIAFGDGMNDAEMLAIVGKGCIMGNAHQRLKDLHPELEVIGTNIDNAVSKYLSKLYLK